MTDRTPSAATVVAMSASAVVPPAGTESPPGARRTRLFSLRWKLLIAFAGTFTIVFVLLAVWIFQYSTTTTTTRLQTQLEDSAVGGSQTINGDEFVALIDTVPPVEDPSNPTGLGYPDAPTFDDIAAKLYTINLIVPDANPYTYFRDPADGQLYFAVSGGAAVDPPIGVPYKVPVSTIVNAETYALMERGLTATVRQDPYTDDYGSWISSYTPIYGSDGASVGAIGVDYPLTYVAEVQRGVQERLYPVLGAIYVILLALVLVLSTSLTRPLKRLTAATERIASGEYDIDATSVVRTRLPDELATLAQSVASMAAKVAARERSLTQEVQRLKVEIDVVRREASVREITETDFFTDLTSKAADMRRRIRGEDQQA